jgi:hypothetical protein
MDKKIAKENIENAFVFLATGEKTVIALSKIPAGTSRATVIEDIIRESFASLLDVTMKNSGDTPGGVQRTVNGDYWAFTDSSFISKLAAAGLKIPGHQASSFVART